jgi:phospholipid/cholesterol/gamma-HCH transport system substrate-binding protein
MAADNVRAATENMNAIAEDLKARDFGAHAERLAGNAERIAGNIDALTRDAAAVVQKFQGADGSSGGLMTEIRQTLSSANEAMADVAENAEAIKHNWFFRGFFNDRGFYDLDAVTVREYNEGRFLKDLQKVSTGLEAADLYGPLPAGSEQITPEGRQKLDIGMAGFLLYSRNDPLIVESWAGGGTDAASVLRSRARAILVSEYLMKRFVLKPNYVAIMPMNAALPAGSAVRDGIGLSMFVPKPSRR